VAEQRDGRPALLMVGKAYTAMLDLKPGDEFEIKLGKKQIKLIPLGSPEEE
jgi:hypothetical protein